MRAFISILIASVIGLVGLQAPAAHAVEAPGSAEPKFVDLANQERAARGLGRMTVAPDLVEYARRHSAEMASQNDLHHSTQLRTLTNWKMLGENVGRGGTVQALHDAFMNSPSHRDNVLRSNFSEVGVGVVTSGDTIWVTFIFREPVTPTPSFGQDVVGITSTSTGDGYWVARLDGSVEAHGDAANVGSAVGQTTSPIAAMASAPGNGGFWLLDRNGGVYAFGDAGYYGSVAALRSQGASIGQAPAASVVSTASGRGYWILDEAGGIFTFGDATFRGSVPGLREAGVPVGSAPVIGIAPTASGGGYWLVDDVGGVFTFGDAGFQGSIPALRNGGQPIGYASVIGMAPTGSAAGYWVLDAAGGVFTFGDAGFLGSIPTLIQSGQAAPGVQGVAVAPTPRGDGYFVLGNSGQVFGFGNVTV